MPLKMPAPLPEYFHALNAKDVPAMLVCFADDALVYDEGHEMEGTEEIHGWIKRTTETYGVSAKPLKIIEREDEFEVIGLVTGDFEGSPIELAYHFMIEEDEIVRLEIALPDEDLEE